MAKAKTDNGKKQAEIPGTERKSIKPLDNAILAYLEARDAHRETTEALTACKATLRQLMTKYAEKANMSVEEYVYKLVDGEQEHTSKMPPLGEPAPKVTTRDLSA